MGLNDINRLTKEGIWNLKLAVNCGKKEEVFSWRNFRVINDSNANKKFNLTIGEAISPGNLSNAKYYKNVMIKYHEEIQSKNQAIIWHKNIKKCHLHLWMRKVEQ